MGDILSVPEDSIVLEILTQEDFVEDVGDCHDKPVCQLDCSFYFPKCTEKLFYDLTPLTKYEPPKNGEPPKFFEELQAYRDVCIKRSGDDSNSTNKILFKKMNKKLSEYTGIPISTIEENVFQGDAAYWNHKYEQLIRGSSIPQIKKVAGEAFVKFLWAIRSFKSLCEKSKYTYREVFDKFAKFDEEYRQRLPQAGGGDYISDPGLYAYLTERQLINNSERQKSLGNMVEYNISNQELQDYRRLKAEFIPVALRIFMNKSVSDYCQCKNFQSWYDRVNTMTATYLYNVYKINKDNLSSFKKYFKYMKKSCKKACFKHKH
jgi:hypothetical protein